MPDTPNSGPRMAKGQRRAPSIESVYKGAYMRSLFEVRFAKQLDARGIVWQYEPERLRGGRYLVDFYLPDLKCWVEVKGRFEARDHLLLPLVAGHLKQGRGERLYLYMKTRAYHVTIQGFEALSHDAFWDAIRPAPDSATDTDSGADSGTDSNTESGGRISPPDLTLPDRGRDRDRYRDRPRRRPW